MDWVDGLNAMEVIIVGYIDLSVGKDAAHHGLGHLSAPGVAMEASWHIWVLSLMTVARRLCVVVALHDHALNERSEHFLGFHIGDIAGEVLSDDLSDEIDN